jgi:hypothetical protein
MVLCFECLYVLFFVEEILLDDSQISPHTPFFRLFSRHLHLWFVYENYLLMPCGIFVLGALGRLGSMFAVDCNSTARDLRIYHSLRFRISVPYSHCILMCMLY